MKFGDKRGDRSLLIFINVSCGTSSREVVKYVVNNLIQISCIQRIEKTRMGPLVGEDSSMVRASD